MKPPPFDYHRPDSVAEAVELLARPGAKVLAGGQSLVPLLNFRLATPDLLVDISGLTELSAITVGPDGVDVGAAVTHRQLERHDGAAASCPLLREAEQLVAHEVIRNRGTACGSIAHADPSGELTAVLAVLRGEVEVTSVRGPRVVPADELFVGPLETSLSPDELLVSARFPSTSDSKGTAFVEVARRHGDYALAGSAAVVGVDAGGLVRWARVALISVGPVPAVVELPDLVGRAVPDLRRDEVYDTVTSAISPDGDLHASADYRRHLAGTTAVDAVARAAGRARIPAAVA